MNEVLYIEAVRDAYATEDVTPRTMKVWELIKELEQYDEDTPVVLRHDSGYTFGFIDCHRVNLEEPEEE